MVRHVENLKKVYEKEHAELLEARFATLNISHELYHEIIVHSRILHSGGGGGGGGLVDW